MSAAFVVLIVALAWWLIPRYGGPPRSIGTATFGRRRDGTPGTGEASSVLVENAGVRTALCSAACGAVAFAMFGTVGMVAGAGAGAVLAWRLGRLDPPSTVRAARQLERDLPTTVDLLAACVRAGLPLDRALLIVGRAVAGPVEEHFIRTEARLRLGADPVSEWTRLTRHPQLGGLARTVARSAESGAPIGTALERLAADLRHEQRTRGQQKAKSVGVRSAAPLAGCFLPAFMLIGVIPTVAGAFAHFVL